MRNLELVTLREILPPSISADPDVLAAAAAIDMELRKTTESIPNVSIIPRIRELTDSKIIDLLAWQFHVDFYDPALPLEIRRELVAKSLDWHTRKGTPTVVEEVASTIFSDAKVTEWWEYGGKPYHFSLVTQTQLPGEAAFAELVNAIWSVKNTRSWLESIIHKSSTLGIVHPAALSHANTTHRAPVPLPRPTEAAVKAQAAAIQYTYYQHKAGGIENYG